MASATPPLVHLSLSHERGDEDYVASIAADSSMPVRHRRGLSTGVVVGAAASPRYRPRVASPTCLRGFSSSLPDPDISHVLNDSEHIAGNFLQSPEGSPPFQQHSSHYGHQSDSDLPATTCHSVCSSLLYSVFGGFLQPFVYCAVLWTCLAALTLSFLDYIWTGWFNYPVPSQLWMRARAEQKTQADPPDADTPVNQTPVGSGTPAPSSSPVAAHKDVDAEEPDTDSGWSDSDSVTSRSSAASGNVLSSGSLLLGGTLSGSTPRSVDDMGVKLSSVQQPPDTPQLGPMGVSFVPRTNAVTAADGTRPVRIGRGTRSGRGLQSGQDPMTPSSARSANKRRHRRRSRSTSDHETASFNHFHAGATQMPTPTGRGHIPTLSIIIAAHNEERIIQSTLLALVERAQPWTLAEAHAFDSQGAPLLEIIVADAGSTDSTGDRVMEFMDLNKPAAFQGAGVTVGPSSPHRRSSFDSQPQIGVRQRQASHSGHASPTLMGSSLSASSSASATDTPETVILVPKRVDVRLVKSPFGRGHALNVGASVARGQHLLFMHADTLLPQHYDTMIRKYLDQPFVAAGAFSFRVDRNSFSSYSHIPTGLSAFEWSRNLGSSLYQMPLGDQALFLHASTFQRLGGYPYLLKFEDLEFSRLLRSHAFKEGRRVVTLPSPGLSSGRRWEVTGVLMGAVLYLWLALAHSIGIYTNDRANHLYRSMGQPWYTVLFRLLFGEDCARVRNPPTAAPRARVISLRPRQPSPLLHEPVLSSGSHSARQTNADVTSSAEASGQSAADASSHTHATARPVPLYSDPHDQTQGAQDDRTDAPATISHALRSLEAVL